MLKEGLRSLIQKKLKILGRHQEMLVEIHLGKD